VNSAYRLQKNRDFQRIYRRGKSLSTPFMVMIWTNAPKNEIKIGFSVSKKVGKAVVRNRARRRIREAVRVRIPEIVPGHRLIFVARPAVRDASFQEITSSVDRLLRQADLIKGDESV